MRCKVNRLAASESQRKNNGVIIVTATWRAEQEAIKAETYESKIIYPWVRIYDRTTELN